jgi:hypothetical protein
LFNLGGFFWTVMTANEKWSNSAILFFCAGPTKNFGPKKTTYCDATFPSWLSSSTGEVFF